MILSKVVPLVFFLVSRAWAQSDAAECNAGNYWNLNSLNQDPCEVGALLDASCRGVAVYTYPPVNSGKQYSPPKKDNSNDLKCDCNTVMYTLYMACASCQGGKTYPWPMWMADCEVVRVAQYPGNIPLGTTVPRWAFFNVTATPNQTYNETILTRLGRDPEALPTRTDTTSTDSSSSLPGTTAPSPSTTMGSTHKPSSTNVGAIVGGLVGSIVPLTILAIVLFFFHARNRRKQRVEQQAENPEKMDESMESISTVDVYTS